MKRREALASLGGLGALALWESVTGQGARAAEAAGLSGGQGPGSAVEDKASKIRISALEPHISAGRVYLKVVTSFGTVGWGEIKGVEPQVAADLATSMSGLLVGENPTRIEHLWQKLYRTHRNLRGGPFMVHVISGVDMALWDIAGKLWDTPVYRLLGGPTRDRLRVYPSVRATKLGPGGVYEQSSTPADIEKMVAAVKAAREKLGPQGAVMFDAHSALPPATVIQFAAAVQPYDLLFLEEPWVPGNLEACKRIRAAVQVPLATGERDRTIWGVIPYLHEGVIDILQPDCGYTGGISQMKKIAALAEAYYVPLAPHNTQSYLGLTASFHVAASIPLFLIHEGYDDEGLAKIARRSWSVDAEGYASLPEGPGLGVEIDEAALAAAAQDPKWKWTWPGAKLPDGSVADY